MFDLASLDPLFRPRSVAVIGASQSPTKIGGVPVNYLKTLGFGGEIYPINPNYAEIQGLRAYPMIGAVPGPVDLAIMAVPAGQAPGLIEEAAIAGVRSLVMFTAGFAETGGDGEATQRRITALARRTGMRILGPNCLGVMNLSHRLFATFAPPVGMGAFATGPVGLVSQSGAFGGYSFALARARGIGLSAWATTGNEADIEFSDCLAWLAQDDNTEVILGYMEGCRNGPKLIAALDAVKAARKPLVMVKVGRSAEGAAAAASHTASLTGEDAVYDALFRQYGVWRARSIEEFFDLGYAAAVGRLPRSRSVAIVTVSGGVGALMADDAAEYDLDAPKLPEAAQAAIRAIVPFAGTRNPVDVTGQVANDASILQRIFEIILATGQYDNVVSFVSARGLAGNGAPELVEIARYLRATRPDLVVAFCSLFRPELRQALEAEGCLTFDDPSRAIRAVGALGFFADKQTVGTGRVEPGPAQLVPPGAASEVEALAILGRAGIPVVSSHLVRSADEAAAAAMAAGVPVAIKIVSRDIVHKSDIGGVRLGVSGGTAAAAAYDAVIAAANRNAPTARIDGAVVAPMVSGGIECILGVQRDPVFGAVVMFGLGGIHVETLKDVSFRVAPFDKAEAHRMIREIRAFPILAGTRGRPPGDLEALAEALSTLSRFAAGCGDSLATLDLNPFLVLPEGEGAIALDAVLVGTSPEASA